MRSARRADNSAVLVLLNVKIWMETQHFIRPQSLNDLLREGITSIPVIDFMSLSILITLESFTFAILMLMKVSN